MAIAGNATPIDLEVNAPGAHAEPRGATAARHLGSTARAHLRLIVWCRDCRHQVEPDPAEMAERYGAGDDGARLRGEASVRPVRQPLGQHGGERDPLAATRTPQGQLSTQSGRSCQSPIWAPT
jgi:hypothetical protein